MTARFAEYVRALGRGPGRSRALTREEARDAFRMALVGEADPHQLGAFLMLLRYRGETADEAAGFVEAARETAALPPLAIDLDWPSYGAGRTRSLPWFLLAALALADSGMRVLMHGSNEFSTGVSVASALAALGLSPARDAADADRQLDACNFAYLPLSALHPSLARMLDLRRLLGLRSPANTVARLLDPFSARAGVDGVFHPSYVDLHERTAMLLGRPRLLIVKGAGGEAERNPAKETRARLHQAGRPPTELAFSPMPGDEAAQSIDLDGFCRVQFGALTHAAAERRIVGAIALALCASQIEMNPGEADRQAWEIWRARAEGSRPRDERTMA